MREANDQRRIDQLENEISQLNFLIKNKEAYRKKKKSGIAGIIVGGALLVLGIIIYTIAFFFLPVAIEDSGNAWIGFGGFLTLGVIVMISCIIPFGIGTPKLVIGSIRFTKACNAELRVEQAERELNNLKNN